MSFGFGVSDLTHDAVASLGVPNSKIASVVASHSQVYAIWNRPPSGYSQDRFSHMSSQADGLRATSRAMHCEWVERDLIKLERIDTTINMADHFTKSLSPILFRRHTDYIMGRVPPNYAQCNPSFRLSNKGDERRVHQSESPMVHRLVHTWTTILGLSVS